MNRSSKIFKVIGAICAVANFAAAIFPVTIHTQINYADQKANAISYLKNFFMGRTLPFDNIALTSHQIMIILGCILLPLLLALFAGIFGFFGDYKQVVSTILSALMLILFIIGYFNVGTLYGSAGKDVAYETGLAPLLFVILSACSVLLGIIGIICTPKMKESTDWEDAVIPEIHQIKEEQENLQYNQIPNEEEVKRPYVDREDPQRTITAATMLKPSVPEAPKGILVGLKGPYEGAEIPMHDGDVIYMGRATDNNLVFSGQNKVSRKHCKIMWNKEMGTYLFTDFSANGTFVYGSSDCLPSNIELEIQPGTVLALGDESNIFKLT